MDCNGHESPILFPPSPETLRSVEDGERKVSVMRGRFMSTLLRFTEGDIYQVCGYSLLIAVILTCSGASLMAFLLI